MKKIAFFQLYIWAIFYFVPKECSCDFSNFSSILNTSVSITDDGRDPEQNFSSQFQWVKSTAKAYKGKAMWIIEGFSDFASLESPTFSHEFGSLNWSLILHRFQENFFVDTKNFKFETPIYARISLEFQTCMGKAISKQQMMWICSTWCNRDGIYLNDLKAIEDAAAINNDTIVINAEFTLFDDERHDHHRINADMNSEYKIPDQMCEMGSDIFHIQEEPVSSFPQQNKTVMS